MTVNDDECLSVAELHAKAATWIADILGKYLPFLLQVSLCICIDLVWVLNFMLVFGSLNAPARYDLSLVYVINCHD